MTNRFASGNAALTVKVVGIILILSFLLDFLILIFPFQPTDRLWQINLATALVDRGIVPLVGIGMLFVGYWIDGVNDSDRQKSLDIKKRAFLTGTQNKYEEYLMSIYSDLKWHYKRLLKDTERLIVIGYSFGDYGVTTEIINWMHKKMDAKLIIIDPNANTLLETGFLIPRLKEAFPERITAINKGFQDLKEADYKSIFST